MVQVKEFLSQLADMAVQVVLIPALLAIGSTLLVIIKSYVQRIGQSLVAKYEMESLKSLTNVSMNLTAEIDKAVDSAVASMMVTVNRLKEENNGELSEEDAVYVKGMARELVDQSLPDSLTTDGEILNKAIGGTEALNTLIAGLIEKHVVEQKVKQKMLK